MYTKIIQCKCLSQMNGGKLMETINRRVCSSTIEKIIYGLGDVGANLCWTFMASFVTLYYTDSAGIAAAAAGSFMLLSRVLDGVTDVICALLMQKVNTRWGKIRPWFWVAAPLLGIGVYISFNIPTGLSDTQKLMWAFLTYTFTGAVAFTIYNLAFTAILPLMSLDQDDRNKASSIQRIICGAGILLIMNVTPILLGIFGGEKSSEAWHTLTLIYAVICTVLVFLMGVIIKEKQFPAEAHTSVEAYVENTDVGTQKKEKVLTVLKKAVFNKYMPLLLIFFISYYVASTMYSGALSYYCRDVMGNLNYMGPLSMAKTIPTMLAIPFCPAAFKKFGKRKVVILTMGIAAAAYILRMVNPANFVWVFIMSAIGGFCSGPASAAMFTFVADLADYVRLSTGTRAESLIAMTSSVGTKLGSGFGSAIIGWGLAIGGYDAALAQQSAGVLFSMNFMENAIPAICIAIAAVCLLLWDMDKRKEKLLNPDK